MTLSSEIIVVSGLPRSGTSLMMQMLDRGGIPILTDQVRTSDADNPAVTTNGKRQNRSNAMHPGC